MTGLKGLRVAKIRGVDLKIHVSLLFLLLYVVLVAAAQFPAIVKQSGVNISTIQGGPVAWGFIFALALFASIAIHEFGHVFVAQSLGVKVRGVTLMMLGGVSEMDEIPEQRLAEFKLSIIGPIVSVALGAVLLFARKLTASPELIIFTHWVGQLNVVLGVFNLLPAFPLDGGRALRSLLSIRLDRVRATQAAVTTSRLLAWTMGILGLLSFNILLMLVAFFIYTTATTELYMILSQKLLSDTKAGEIGLRIKPVDENATLNDAAEIMLQEKITVLPVQMKNGKAGLINLNGIRTIERRRWAFAKVNQLAQEASLVIDANEPAAKALPKLAGTGNSVFPLMENSQVVGLIRITDFADALQFKSLQGQDRSKAA